MLDEILKNLNKDQIKVVKSVSGPILVLAGPGSGKTLTLTYRIAYLMAEKRVSPRNILAVTFTNRAAEEMRGRVEKLLKSSKSKTILDKIQKRAISNVISPYNGLNNNVGIPFIGTFHALCVRVLRRDIGVLKRKQNFVIYDGADSLSCVKQAMRELELSFKEFNPRAIFSFISSAKNELIWPDSFRRQAENYFQEIAGQVYERYQNILEKANALDFDDLLMFCVKLFQEEKRILGSYQDRFQYILVDEYQDTNKVQYVLSHLLAEKHQNIFCIGDDAQAIYRFRGADIRNILEFEHDYKDAKVFKLERNYRSTQSILDLASEVINQNTAQKHKELWTENIRGEKPYVYEARDEEDEGEFVVREIESRITNHESRMLQGHRSRDSAEKHHVNYKDFVVLYRTNKQSRAIEETFIRHNIPYRIVGGVRFYERKEIKDILAYLRLVQDPSDLTSFTRVVNTPPRGIGNKTLGLVERISSDTGKSLCDIARNIQSFRDAGFSNKALFSLGKFGKVIFRARHEKTITDLVPLIDFLLEESGYKEFILDGTEEGKTRWENIEELKNVAAAYPPSPAGFGGQALSLRQRTMEDNSSSQSLGDKQEALNSFLEDVALLSDVDEYDKGSDSVTLMTLHSAKGLEFPVVFIIGVEDNLLPHSQSMFEPADLEEERRLFYVGITRAKEKVYLIHAHTRNLYGGIQANPKSRFLKEIPEDLVQDVGCIGGNGSNSRDAINRVSKNEKNPKPSFKDGDKVSHPSFGEGIIINVEDDIAMVAFSGKGVKKMSLDIAPLKKIK